MRIENRNLKQKIEELQNEVKNLKQRNHEIDLLSDRDRTISENIDLKMKKENQDQEIQKLKEENLKYKEKMAHLKESNEVVSHINFTLEEKFLKEKNDLLLKFKMLRNENKILTEKLEKKDSEINEIKNELKNYERKKEEEMKDLLVLHKDFSLALEKFSKSNKKI